VVPAFANNRFGDRRKSTLMESTRRQFSRRMFIQSSGAAFIGAVWPQDGPQPSMKSIDTPVLSIAYVENGYPAGIPRFCDSSSPRMAEQAAIRQDVVDFAPPCRPPESERACHYAVWRGRRHRAARSGYSEREKPVSKAGRPPRSRGRRAFPSSRKARNGIGGDSGGRWLKWTVWHGPLEFA
jgi:hypothetical protein